MPRIITLYRTVSPRNFRIGCLVICISLANDGDKINYPEKKMESV